MDCARRPGHFCRSEVSPSKPLKKGCGMGVFPSPEPPPHPQIQNVGSKRKLCQNVSVKTFGQNVSVKTFGQNFRSKRFGQNLLAPKPLTISINPKPQTLNPKLRNPKLFLSSGRPGHRLTLGAAPNHLRGRSLSSIYSRSQKVGTSLSSCP